MVKLPIMCVMGKNVSQVLNGDRLTDTMKKRWVNVMGFSFDKNQRLYQNIRLGKFNMLFLKPTNSSVAVQRTVFTYERSAGPATYKSFV